MQTVSLSDYGTHLVTDDLSGLGYIVKAPPLIVVNDASINSLKKS